MFYHLWIVSILWYHLANDSWNIYPIPPPPYLFCEGKRRRWFSQTKTSVSYNTLIVLIVLSSAGIHVEDGSQNSLIIKCLIRISHICASSLWLDKTIFPVKSLFPEWSELLGAWSSGFDFPGIWSIPNTESLRNTAHLPCFPVSSWAIMYYLILAWSEYTIMGSFQPNNHTLHCSKQATIAPKSWSWTCHLFSVMDSIFERSMPQVSIFLKYLPEISYLNQHILRNLGENISRRCKIEVYKEWSAWKLSYWKFKLSPWCFHLEALFSIHNFCYQCIQWTCNFWKIFDDLSIKIEKSW